MFIVWLYRSRSIILDENRIHGQHEYTSAILLLYNVDAWVTTGDGNE